MSPEENPGAGPAADPLRVAVILAAAGTGSRFAPGRAPGAASGGASGGTKVEEEIAGRPAFAWSLRLLRARPEVVAVVLAVDPARRAAFAERWAEELTGSGAGFAPVAVVGGGPDRDATVRLALAAAPPDATHVAVHDAARPALSGALLDRLFAAAAAGHPAVFPGVPVVDTLRRVGAGGRAGATVSRDGLVAVQTPQVFEAGVLRRAHATPVEAGVTDDAGRVAALGVSVFCVPGDPANRKLTVPADLAPLEETLRRRGATRPPNPLTRASAS